MIQAKTRPGSPPSHAGNSVPILPEKGLAVLHDSNGGDFPRSLAVLSSLLICETLLTTLA